MGRNSNNSRTQPSNLNDNRQEEDRDGIVTEKNGGN